MPAAGVVVVVFVVVVGCAAGGGGGGGSCGSRSYSSDRSCQSIFLMAVLSVS